MLRIAVAFMAIAYVASTSCERKAAKYGCLKKNSIVFPDPLANNRDASSSVFTGDLLNWNKFNESLHSLACACEAKAIEGGYKYYAIGYYGECDGGKDEDVFEAYASSPASLADVCLSNNYMDCIKEEPGECTGVSDTVYAYVVPHDEGSGGEGSGGNDSKFII